jgi:hypothetical protein
MNEMAFGLKVAEHLSVSTRQIDDRIALRLRAAREQALAVQRPPVWWSGLSGRALGLRLRFALAPGLRSLVTVLVLLAIFVGGDRWTTASRVESLQQVDAALLIDDLPIEAYLDPEFRLWLARDS